MSLNSVRYIDHALEHFGHFVHFYFLFQPPKKDTKGSSKQPQKTQKKKEGGSGGKAKKKVCILFLHLSRIEEPINDEHLYS